MKLKKAEEGAETLTPVAPAGGAVIADRFKLDVDDGAKGPPGVGKVGATCALIGSLVAIAALGIVAWLLYQNWELVKDF
ncbi:MAG: hypothetical protein IJL17_04400 [Kiritimatiellae bacterium]|nr:hypothetical protein [Kiritimatiellia bacterium]